MYLRRILLFTAAITMGCAIQAAAYNAPSKVTFQGAPPPAKSRSFTAVVNKAGNLVRGSGATSAAAMEDAGSYEVDFNGDVSQCAYTATVGEPGSSGSEPASLITVVSRSGDPSGIFVQTFKHDGKLKALPFQVDVGC
jgi:hypothetical protein